MKTAARVVSAILLMGVSGGVFAELYVSPVVRGAVTLDAPSDPSAEGAATVRSVSGHQEKSGFFLMRETDDMSVMRFGKNVPLFVALENLVPKDWTAKIDDGLEALPVSWSGGDDWQGVVGEIANGNELKLAVNAKDKRLGISRDEDAARNLASRMPIRWSLKSGRSMRDNLQEWTKLAGWSLDWSIDVDYPIEHAAQFSGPFNGEGGVVDQLLQGTADSNYPLSAIFYSGNQVLRVVEAGFRQDKTGANTK